MNQSTAVLSDALKSQKLVPDDITEDLFEKCLWCPEAPDLLIRTSGEKRLSDFLLWQTAYSCIVFSDVLWPDFSHWSLLDALLQFQQSYALMTQRREKEQEDARRRQLRKDTAILLATPSVEYFEKRLERMQEQRLERQTAFLKELEQQRAVFFERLALERDKEVSNSQQLQQLQQPVTIANNIPTDSELRRRTK